MKEIIYWGLLKLVLADPLMAGEVFDFLLPHFLQYYREASTPVYFISSSDFFIAMFHFMIGFVHFVSGWSTWYNPEY